MFRNLCGGVLVHDEFSVAAPVARWRAAFVAVFVLLFMIKLRVAATLSPFGDEAFYWQESRHPAWGYSDLPPMTAWLIRLGETVAGHSLLGMRWPFLLIGGVLPWLLVALGRQAFGARAGWQAGLLCMALPLAGSLGVMALPDVPLTVAVLLATLFLLRAAECDRLGDWLMLGVALGLGWLTHYRAAMPMLAGLLFLVAAPRGRAQWRRPGLWLAVLAAACGMVPLLISNWQQHGAGMAFQMVDRNPWRFHAGALAQPLEQAIACTPLLYALLLWAAWQCWRRRAEGAPWDLLAFVALGFIGLYFLLGLFADDLRFRAHWPLPGYLPLLPALPVLLHRQACSGRRLFVGAALGLAVVGQAAGMAYLGLAASSHGPQRLAGSKAFPSNFVGWRESGEVAGSELNRHPAVLVADNFLLAAELDFQLDGHAPVYSLDSPLNVTHGRAPQLAVWRRDEAGLHAAHAGEPMLLAVDETALRERERWPWLGSLCGRINDPWPLKRLDLFGGRKHIAFYTGRVPASAAGAGMAGGDCMIRLQARAANVDAR